MNTTAISRRQLLRGIAATIAAGAVVKSDLAFASAVLDSTYCRAEPPYLCVDHPSTWSVTERLVTELIDPIQLVHLSNAQLKPHNSRFSGLPDLTLLPRDAALLSVRGSRYDPDSDVAFRDAAQGIGRWNLDAVEVEASDIASLMAWYRLGDIVYELYLWVGPTYHDWDTLQAIVQSLRISRT